MPDSADPSQSRLQGVRRSAVTMAVELADGERVARSWARQPHDPFPEYDSLWPIFAAELARARQRQRDAGAVEPPVRSCELVYENPVSADEELKSPRQLDRLLMRSVGRHLAGGFLPGPAEVVADASFPMSGADGQPAGELTVSARAVAAESPEPLLGVTVAARGAARGPEPDGVEDFFDTAFGWVVLGAAAFLR